MATKNQKSSGQKQPKVMVRKSSSSSTDHQIDLEPIFKNLDATGEEFRRLFPALVRSKKELESRLETIETFVENSKKRLPSAPEKSSQGTQTFSSKTWPKLVSIFDDEPADKQSMYQMTDLERAKQSLKRTYHHQLSVGRAFLTSAENTKEKAGQIEDRWRLGFGMTAEGLSQTHESTLLNSINLYFLAAKKLTDAAESMIMEVIHTRQRRKQVAEATLPTSARSLPKEKTTAPVQKSKVPAQVRKSIPVPVPAPVAVPSMSAPTQKDSEDMDISEESNGASRLCIIESESDSDDNINIVYDAKVEAQKALKATHEARQKTMASRKAKAHVKLTSTLMSKARINPSKEPPVKRTRTTAEQEEDECIVQVSEIMETTLKRIDLPSTTTPSLLSGVSDFAGQNTEKTLSFL